jgi:hypothetical protein
MPTGIGDNIRPVRDHYDKLFDLLDRGKLINWTGSAAVADRLQDQRIADGRKNRLPSLPVVGCADFRRKRQCDALPFKEGLMMLWTSFLDVYTSGRSC